jgi:hypothetical protein
MPEYLHGTLKNVITAKEKKNPCRHVYFCICDHFEPYWNHADTATARKRLKTWMNNYPKIAEAHPDSDGNPLKYSFFYPEEEYRVEDLNELSQLCKANYGEVEIHLHHDNDTAENLRRLLGEYKKRLHESHGLLSIDGETKAISYGFIHGNWALDNSNPDGTWCGVNNEIDILQETGCYGDFTMPSAPHVTQTRKINSIYYAIDDPERPKSHDSGIDARVGRQGKWLLMVQGPLCLNWKRRKFGILPRIENGGLVASNPITRERVQYWLNQRVHVRGASDSIFVKIYTHGTQESNMAMLFKDNGLSRLLTFIAECVQSIGAELHYVSARECVNIILALLEGQSLDINRMKNFRYCCS